MKIKLCGFTEVKTIETAIDYGCDFIGVVFAKNSIRYVDPNSAKILSTIIPDSIGRVAVVVNETLGNLHKINQNFQPNFFQLHGDEDINYIENLKKIFPKISIIKAISIFSKDDLNKIKNFDNLVDYFLLDNKNPGSGEVFDWKILQDFNLAKPYFLSGGINIKNIDEAIKIVNPEFIDISSGIEEIKGIKSSKLIIEMLQKIKTINQNNNNL
jgi:phosphoribosylanthranilate isomerase